MILNRSYHRVATVHAAEGYHADLHEFRLTSHHTALITSYETVRADLSSIGGPRHGSVVDGIVQEIDVRTGRLLWEWHALGHVPLSASYLNKRRGRPQSTSSTSTRSQELPGGDMLISGRNTWAVYRVSRRPATSSGSSAGRARASIWVRGPSSPGSTTPRCAATAAHAVR